MTDIDYYNEKMDDSKLDPRFKEAGTREANQGASATPEQPKQSKDSKSLPFDSDFEPASPHMIILEIIRQAMRNGERFEVDTANTVNPNIAYSLSIGREIDEYVERLVHQVEVDGLEALIEHPRVYQDLGNGYIIHYVHVKDIRDRIKALSTSKGAEDGDSK